MEEIQKENIRAGRRANSVTEIKAMEEEENLKLKLKRRLQKYWEEVEEDKRQRWCKEKEKEELEKTRSRRQKRVQRKEATTQGYAQSWSDSVGFDISMCISIFYLSFLCVVCVQ